MTIRALADRLPASDVLAYIPSPPRGVWDIGGFPLRAYALCIIIGIIAAIWWGEKRWQQRGGQQGMVLDVAMFAVPFGLIGGRLYHVATDWQKYFGENGHPIDALKIWEGGLGIWGAVLLGGIGAWIGCRIYRIPLPAFADAVAPGVLLAQAIGRLGNYFNQELYGRETTVPWGLEIYERFDGIVPDMMNGTSSGVVIKVVQPTFLYEMVWNLLGVAVLVYIDRKFRIGHGRLFALYVAIYCFGRFFVELLRDDEATHIAGIRINTFTSVIVFVGAVAYVVLATKGRETADQMRAEVIRPWPWEFAKLRAYGAGPAEAVVLGKDTALGKDATPAVDAEDTEPESATDGNESAIERDKSSESGSSTPAVEVEAAKTADSGKNDS
ncbi:prolipoprotein diacylglyceryl transferase [Nocardia sp. NPDC005978]|uniref:prolipoprotein diacylglyceryl transferase n=1 Tax=unclassified Nocardia TaxID=2637762 RepID=UPI0033B62D14